MDCSQLNSTVHGVLPARILEWVAISFSIKSYKDMSKKIRAGGGGEYRRRGGIDWEFEIEHVHPAVVKIDNQQDPTVKKINERL